VGVFLAYGTGKTSKSTGGKKWKIQRNFRTHPTINFPSEIFQKIPPNFCHISQTDLFN
jgi:hypothetical protein